MNCDRKGCQENAWLVLFFKDTATGNEFQFIVCPKHYKEVRDDKAWDWIYDIKDSKMMYPNDKL